ncbi:hypothetical protein MMC21_007492 [Puttea exsequens]|nr:hypothetical protein [Puttea exsequens]
MTNEEQCDEQVPKCGRCQRGNTDCSLEELSQNGFCIGARCPPRGLQPPSQLARSKSDSPTSLFTAPSPNLPDTAFELRAPLRTQMSLMDLELMHQWTTVTYMSQSNIPSKQQIWQQMVPREAQSYDFLMHGLLAIAAVQLMTLRPSRDNEYEEAARRHQNFALTKSIPHLHNITSTNCHALFVLAVIMAMLAFRFPHLSHNNSPSAPTDTIMDFFQLVRGVRAVIESSAEWVVEGKFGELLQYEDSPLVSLPPELACRYPLATQGTPGWVGLGQSGLGDDCALVACVGADGGG